MLDRLKEILSGLADGYGKLVDMNGESDHIHLLVELNPKASPSIVANNWKTVTSRLLRRDFEQELATHYSKPVLWSRSYFVASCGGAPLSVIRQYIEQQERPE